VLYPSIEDLKAYLSWRQVDCHINNLYNTLFWKLVKEGGLSTTEAHAKLKGTFSKDKHEMLFSMFKCNYNDEPDIFKRGNILIRQSELKKRDQKKQCEEEKLSLEEVIVVHEDLIEKEGFYEKYMLNERLN